MHMEPPVPLRMHCGYKLVSPQWHGVGGDLWLTCSLAKARITWPMVAGMSLGASGTMDLTVSSRSTGELRSVAVSRAESRWVALGRAEL